MSKLPKKEKRTRKNLFTKKYEEYQKSGLRDELDSKFEHKPYYERYGSIKKFCKISSFAFNGLSVLTAASAVFFFLNPYLHYLIFSLGITALFIVLLEWIKRSTATNWFKDVMQFKKYSFNLGLISIVLMIMSALFSFHGSKQAIREFKDQPTYIVTESFTEKYDVQIAQINEEIEAARNTTYLGNTTRKSQATIDKLTEQRQIILDRKYKVEDQTLIQNKEALNQHKIETEGQAIYFACFTLGCELFFLLCIWYMEYYDYRSHKEFEIFDLAEDEEKQEEREGQIILMRTAVRQEFNHLLKQPKEQAALKSKKEPKQIGERRITDHQSDNTPQEPANKTEETKPSKKQEPSPVEEKVNRETAMKKRADEAKAEQIKQLKTAISKLKRKISLAKFRLKSNQGNKETHEMNIERATQEMETLERRLDELSRSARA